MEAFGVELTNRDVIRDDGSQVGRLDNVRYDPTTGQLKHLLVEPVQHQRSPPFETTDEGLYKIPAGLVTACDDCIVVGR